MPSKPPEPSNYSLDEMLDRLREGERDKREEREAGELVTRPDGSQVVRVKRRKRRTDQPASKQARKKGSLKKVKIFAALSLLALALLGMVGALIQLAKFNSEGFRGQLEQDLSSASGGKVSLNRLTVTPVKVRAESAKVAWADSSLVQSAAFRHLEANLGVSAFMGSGWNGARVQARQGSLRLAGEPTMSYPTFKSGSLFNYEEFICNDMDLFLGQGESPPVLFEGVELSVRGEGEVKQAIIHGGSAELRDWGSMEVGSGVVRFENGGCVLSTLRLTPEGSRGDIIVRGEDVILPGKESKLEVILSKVSLGHLLGAGFGRILDATVSSEQGTFTFTPAGLHEMSLELPVKGTGGELTSLPFLFSLRTILSDTEFAKPYFREVSAVIDRKGDDVTIRDLVMSEKGFMEIRGLMSVSGEGNLSGNLRVGVHENKAISATGRKRTKAFSDPVGGYVWLEIELGGTVDVPEDNSSTLFQEAAAAEAADLRRQTTE